MNFASRKVSGSRRRGNARSLWPSVLRSLALSPRTTAEHILDCWARFHTGGGMRLSRLLARIDRRLGDLLAFLREWRTAWEMPLDTCVGCGEPGPMVCDDCVDRGLCEDCGSIAPHFIVRPTGKRVCPRDRRAPTGTEAC